MRVGITGITGYVGGAVARTLRARGHSVLGLVRPDADVDDLRALGFALLPGELSELDVLARMASEVDAIFHGAFSERRGFASLNERAIAALLDALEPSKPFVLPGMSAVFGDSGARILDESAPLAPIEPLAQRAELERRLLGLGARGRRLAIVHAPLVYGGDGARIPRILLEAARGEGVAPFVGTGSNRWSTVHIRDWASLIVLALERGPAGGHTFFAAGPSFSMREIADEVAFALGWPELVRSISPEEADELWGPFHARALRLSQQLSGEKAARLLGWRPAGPSLGEELGRLARALFPEQAEASWF